MGPPRGFKRSFTFKAKKIRILFGLYEKEELIEASGLSVFDEGPHDHNWKRSDIVSIIASLLIIASVAIPWIMKLHR